LTPSKSEPGKDGQIDFYFSIGSMYTFLTVMRMDRVEDVTDIRFVWRPFSVRDIMIEMDNRPMSKPRKLAYMWRDLHRSAEMYGFAFEGEAPYPLKEFDLANKLAVLGLAEGWGIPYIQASYRRWFVEGQEPGLEPNLSQSLAEAGQDAARSVERAGADDVAARYEAATAEAKQLGIFGSPTFAVDGELFWGDDRLDDALKWFSNGRL